MAALLAALAGVLGAVALLGARRALAGTTLAAPAGWALAALAALTLVAALTTDALAQSPAGSHLRYLAGCCTLAPWMAVLGANRPRDRGWPWVVVVLWVILALPSGEGWLLRPGLALRLEDARAWFLALLLGLEWLTYAGTRFWAPCTLLVAAQGLLFAEQLPFMEYSPLDGGPTLAWWRTWAPLVSLAGVTLALWLAWLVRPHRTALGLERQWLDFRDAYGLLWGLRVAERFNAASSQYGWPVRIGWLGVTQLSNAEQPAGAKVVWENLLIRFVSPAWLAARQDGQSISSTGSP